MTDQNSLSPSITDTGAGFDPEQTDTHRANVRVYEGLMGKRPIVDPLDLGVPPNIVEVAYKDPTSLWGQEIRIGVDLGPSPFVVGSIAFDRGSSVGSIDGQTPAGFSLDPTALLASEFDVIDTGRSSGKSSPAPALADTHIMVDLETLGTTPGSVILSIGAVAFDPKAGTLGETFYANISASSCTLGGLTVDPKTEEWWREQTKEAKAVLLSDRLPLHSALVEFVDFWSASAGKYFWSHGPSFDESILAAAFRAVGMTPPWHHSDVRCTRTIYDLAGVWPNRDVGIPHYALDDARNQAVAVNDGYAKLRPVPQAESRKIPHPDPWPAHIPAPLVLNDICRAIHADNVKAGWWTDIKTGKPLDRNVGELLMLVVSEIREGWQGQQGGLMDDKLPHRPMLEVELADALIRIYDIAGAHGLELGSPVSELVLFDLVEKRGMWEPVVNGAFMRIIDEVCRAMEGHRKGAQDETLPQRKAFEVGLAAAVIRIYDLGHACGYDLAAAIGEKRAFNRTRADHKPENRRAAGGKAY